MKAGNNLKTIFEEKYTIKYFIIFLAFCKQIFPYNIQGDSTFEYSTCVYRF